MRDRRSLWRAVRWSAAAAAVCGVTVQPFRPGAPDERLDAPSIDRAVAEWYAMTNAEREAEKPAAADEVGYPKGWPAGSTPRREEIVPSKVGWPGWRWSGSGLSGTPPAGSISGRWVESAYGWPVASFRIRGLGHGGAFSWDAVSRAQPPVGSAKFAVSPRAAAFNFLVFAGPAFILGVPNAAWVQHARRRRRERLGWCVACGYDRGGVQGACSECGMARSDA